MGGSPGGGLHPVQTVDLPIVKGTDAGTEDVAWVGGDGVTGTYRTDVTFFTTKGKDGASFGKVVLTQSSDAVGEICNS